VNGSTRMHPVVLVLVHSINMSVFDVKSPLNHQKSTFYIKFGIEFKSYKLYNGLQ